jgi:hypothetical protein
MVFKTAVLSRVLSTGQILLPQIPECRTPSKSFPGRPENMKPRAEEERFPFSF